MSLYAEPDTLHTLGRRAGPLVDWTQKPSSVIGQYIGAAAACWENLYGAGEFQSQRASRIVDEILDYVESLGLDTRRTS
jgi:hypothetical protein